MEFAYNNVYHTYVKMVPFQALYGRRFQSLIRWFKLGEAKLIGLDLVEDTMSKVKVVKERP